MTSDEILKKHEDANEYHLHRLDRKWVMEAMEEYAFEAWRAARFKYTKRPENGLSLIPIKLNFKKWAEENKL